MWSGLDTWAALPWAVALVVSVTATVTDVRSRRVPNALTLPVLVCGVLWSTAIDGWIGLGSALGACVLLAVPYVFLFLYAGGGAGDAKLMAAIGAWLGLGDGVVVLAAVAFSGAILAFVFAGRHGKAGALWGQFKKMVLAGVAVVFRHTRWHEAPRLISVDVEPVEMPYSIAVLAGVCATLAAVGVGWM